MSLLKSIERIRRMDSMIRKQSTGTAKEFSEKMGISRSMLMENLREMRDLGAEIEFCPFRRSYYYTSGFILVIGGEEKKPASKY